MALALLADALCRHPDIAQTEYNPGRRQHYAVRHPQTSFVRRAPDPGGTGLLLLNLKSNPTKRWTLGSSLLAPLFPDGRLQAQAIFIYRRTTLIVFRDVKEASEGVGRLAEQSAGLER